MFVVQRRVSRAEKWFRVVYALVILAISPYAVATIHWATREKTPPK